MAKGSLTIQDQHPPKKEKKNKKIHKQIHPIELIGQPQSSEVVEAPTINKHINLHTKQKLKHLAICFPDSILEIPQNSDLRAYFVSEVARICSIFKVDEIIILRDHAYKPKSENFKPTQYLVRNLQYLETPQYLRKYLFKMHPDLQKAGIMNPIECPHHLKSNEVSEFREGVSVERPTKKGAGSWVDIGLTKQAQLDVLVLPNTRLTVRIENYDDPDATFYKAEAVSKKMPLLEKNIYWGYDVRIANNLKEMVDNDYDMRILCNHQQMVQEVQGLLDFDNVDLEDKSVLLFFGGTDDLQTLINKDDRAKMSPQEAHRMFEFCFGFQGHGVQQLRIQEQMFISLTKLSKYRI